MKGLFRISTFRMLSTCIVVISKGKKKILYIQHKQHSNQRASTTQTTLIEDHRQSMDTDMTITTTTNYAQLYTHAKKELDINV
jgi:hypothetical protein